MDKIIFPKREWSSIKGRFATGKEVWTVRVDQEIGKYVIGYTYMTEWGSLVQVVSTKRITSINDYEFVGELTGSQRSELEKYGDLEVIRLRRCQKLTCGHCMLKFGL